MKRLIINLDRSPTRLAHMSSLFDRLQLGFERFSAIDGSQLPAESINRINACNQWVRPLTRAEVGCLLSHRGCWEIIAAGAEAFGAIFEDDMEISSVAGPFLRSSEWIPAGIEFVKLETRRRNVTIGRRAIRLAGGRRLVRLGSFHDGLGGYVVSKRCAEWLCGQTQRCTGPVDQLVLNPQFALFDAIGAFQLTPAVCIPATMLNRAETDSAGMPSTIDPDGSLYRSDDALLRLPEPARRPGSIRRETNRMSASLRRLVRGQQKKRIEYQ